MEKEVVFLSFVHKEKDQMIKNEKVLGETWKWARGRDFRTSHQDGGHQRAATMAPNRQNDKGDHVWAHTIPELTPHHPRVDRAGP